MDEIELDNLGEDPIPEEEEGVKETNTDWRDGSMIIMGGFNPELQQGLEEEEEQPEGQIQGVRDRWYTEDKKIFLKN